MNRPWKIGSRSRSRALFAAVVSAGVALLTSATLAGDVTYTYDVHGRLIKRETISQVGDSVTVDSTYDNAGNRTSVATSTVDTITPTVPTGLTGSAISATQINLSWNASIEGGGSGFAGYKIRRNGTQIGTSASTSYSDTTVVGSTTYQYTVSAYDNQPNESAQSSPINVSTPDITPPSVPTGLTGYSVNSTWVNISWNASTDTGGSGLAGYEIYRNGSFLNTSATTSYADHTVAAATQYTYTVKAYDGASNHSAASSGFTLTTPNAPDTTPPSVPTGLGASSPNSSTVNLSWAASTDPGPGGTGVAGYQVYRGGSYLGTTGATSLADTTVSCGTYYTYQVRSYDGVPNYSALSGAAGITVSDTIAPSTPTGLSVSAPASNQVNLSWTASSDVCSGVAGYVVYRNGTYIGSSATTSFTDTGTVANTYYYYQVQAFDGAASRNYSGTTSAVGVTTPDTIPPSAPGAITIGSITGSTASASWGAASDNIGVTGYRYSLNGGSSWTNVSTTSASLTGLLLNTGYTLLVQARDAAGNWGASSSQGFTTLTYYTDTLTMMAGSSGDGWTEPYKTGYNSGAIGSLSPTSLYPDKAIAAYYTSYMMYFDGANWTTTTVTYLQISGFSSTPQAGKNWLNSITGGLTGAGASSFSCGGGYCVWQWATYVGPFGSPQSIVIQHQ